MPDDTLKAIFKGVDVSKVQPETMDMIKNPYFKLKEDPYTGQLSDHVLKEEAFILLRLYELTIVNPNNSYVHQGTPYTDPHTGEVFDPAYGVKREDLLQMAGIANKGTQGEASTYFGDYKTIGLAYINPANVPADQNYVFPGGLLEAYVKGALSKSMGAQTYNRTKKQMEPFSNDVNDPRNPGQAFDSEVGKLPDRPKKTSSASKTRNPGAKGAAAQNPFANIPGISVVPQQNSSKVDDEPYFGHDAAHAEAEPAVEQQPEAPAFRKLDPNKFKRFKKNSEVKESFNLTGDAYLIKEDMQFIEDVKKAYREWRGLPEGEDLTNHYNEFDFNAMCCCNKWPVEATKNKIWKGMD